MNDFLQMALTVCPLIFLASTVDAIAGGGGLISLPAYLLTGMPVRLAGGTNKMSASIGTLAAVFKYSRGGKILWKAAWIAVFGALPGAWLGAQLLSRAGDQIARGALLAALPAMACVIIFRKNRREELRPLTQTGLVLCFFIGLFVGFYDGFLGPGTGTLLIILFTSMVGMDTVTASGSAKLVNLASNLAALLAHMQNGNVYYLLALPAMVCSIAGGYLGAHLAMKSGAKVVRIVMLIVVFGLIVKLLWDGFAHVN